MKHLPLPELNFLKSILSYCPDTGIFIWKVNRGRLAKAGQIAGYLQLDKKRPDYKYFKILICGKAYRVNRLAYYYMTEIDPAEKEVDHKNGNPLDNRFDNLRLATHANNGKNRKIRKGNSSGFKGVTSNGNNWEAGIRVNYDYIYLGTYNSKFYAALVYARAAKKYFGEWRRLKFNF